MSAFFSFMLYVAVLLRVRGNLIQDTAGKWSLRWIARSESWQLGFARDYIDSCLVKMVAIIVWYASDPSPCICHRASLNPIMIMLFPGIP